MARDERKTHPCEGVFEHAFLGRAEFEEFEAFEAERVGEHVRHMVSIVTGSR